MGLIKRLFVEEDGGNAAEYALLIALIAVVMAVGATALGTTIDAKFDEVTTKLGGTAP